MKTSCVLGDGSLLLRKLGPGEAMDTGKQYATRMRDTGEWYDAGYPGTLGRETWDNVDIYELPAHTPEMVGDPPVPGMVAVPREFLRRLAHEAWMRLDYNTNRDICALLGEKSALEHEQGEDAP